MENATKVIGAFVLVCLGIGVIVGNVALVVFALRPTAPINVHVDRDGRPVVVPYQPTYPQPHYPHRPGNVDTGSKAAK